MEIERIRLQYEITNAQLLYEVTPAKMNISVKHGQLDIQHEPLKLVIDNQSFSESAKVGADASQARGKAALDAAGRYSREKSATLNPAQMNSAEIAAAQTAQASAAGEPAGERPKLTWTGGKVTIKAERDEVSVDWQPQSVDFRYVPYSVEFYIDKW